MRKVYLSLAALFVLPCDFTQSQMVKVPSKWIGGQPIFLRGKPKTLWCARNRMLNGSISGPFAMMRGRVMPGAEIIHSAIPSKSPVSLPAQAIPTGENTLGSKDNSSRC